MFLLRPATHGLRPLLRPCATAAAPLQKFSSQPAVAASLPNGLRPAPVNVHVLVGLPPPRSIHTCAPLLQQQQAAGHDDEWTVRFEQLRAHKARTGFFHVSHAANPALHKWYQNQLKNVARLSPERTAQLEKIGFAADYFQKLWDERISELKQFIAEHGHMRIPPSSSPGLALWVAKKRVQPHRAQLSEERVAQLDQLGFDWNPYHNAWAKRLDELRVFKQDHGHCNVPKGFAENKQLATWVAEARRSRKRSSSSLTLARVAELDELGFQWSFDGSETLWNNRAAELEQYFAVHGVCDLPQSQGVLGRWVSRQRVLHSTGDLTDTQINRLEQLGITWNLYDAAFDAKLAALQAFAAEHGHTDVNRKFSESLGSFVSVQRKLKRTLDRRLTPDRIARLDQIGFCWDPCVL